MTIEELVVLCWGRALKRYHISASEYVLQFCARLHTLVRDSRIQSCNSATVYNVICRYVTSRISGDVQDCPSIVRLLCCFPGEPGSPGIRHIELSAVYT